MPLTACRMQFSDMRRHIMYDGICHEQIVTDVTTPSLAAALTESLA